MNRLLEFTESDDQIRLSVRRAKEGPEQELVRRFVTHIAALFTTPGTALAVFYEPLLATGFPDIVIAAYQPTVFERWSATRLTLPANAFKLLQHLHWAGRTEWAIIQQHVGMPARQLTRELERLHQADLARPIGTAWEPVSLAQVFGITRLIAIEAKMRDWKGALEQAHTNTWFASETYVLSPVQKPTARPLREAIQLGIGVYLCHEQGAHQILPSPVRPQPRCPASWLFNEWIGRRLHAVHQGTTGYAFTQPPDYSGHIATARSHHAADPGWTEDRLPCSA